MPSDAESMQADAAMRHRAAPIHRDVGVAELAARQHGVVRHDQLRTLGFGASAVQRAISAGRLHPLYRGVYAVGHPAVSPEGRRLAAVLVCGHGAVLSHRSAAALWELRPSSRARTDVTVPHRHLSPPGIDLHHTARLDTSDVGVRAGIPVTSVSRTLADLASILDGRALEKVLERSASLRVLDAPSLLAAVVHRRGAPEVRRILASWEPVLTRSELEVALRRLVLRSEVPPPEVNVTIVGMEVDLLWRAARVVAEADSVQFHLTRAAMERDRMRDAILARHGYRVLRFTDRQVRHRPHEVIEALRAAPAGSMPLRAG
jgi:very-short-patch-repair endonuclease